MEGTFETIRSLVAADDIDEAAARLSEVARGIGNGDLAAEVVALQGSLARAARDHRRGVVDDDDFERSRRRAAHQALAILEELRGFGSPEPSAGARGAVQRAASADASPAVFLSYNYGDAEVALRLEEALEARGLVVHVDRDAMEAGEGIESFIERSVAATDATVCVISNRSLRSAWVAAETIQAFYARKGSSARRFIAAYLDDDFFQPRFRLEVTADIDARIGEIEALLPEYADKRLDTSDLDAEKTRLYALRNDLGRILAHLKESLALDLRGDAFDGAVERIVSTLTG
jgi:hypothetical protein